MNFADALKKWNGGIKRGAARKFAAKIGLHETTIGDWVRGIKLPGEEIRPRIARELNISVDALMRLFHEEIRTSSMVSARIPSGRGIYSMPGIVVPQIPIVGKVRASGCDYAPNEAPDGFLQVTAIPPHGHRLGALIVSGDCMEPTAHDGENIIVRDMFNEKPEHRDLVVISYGGGIMLRRFHVGADGFGEYREDNKRFGTVRIKDGDGVIALAKVYLIVNVRRPPE